MKSDFQGIYLPGEYPDAVRDFLEIPRAVLGDNSIDFKPHQLQFNIWWEALSTISRDEMIYPPHQAITHL